MAGAVGDDYRGGACREREPHQLGYQLGVGVGRLLGGSVPGTVGLDDHLLTPADELFDATQGRERPLQVGGGPCPWAVTSLPDALGSMRQSLGRGSVLESGG